MSNEALSHESKIGSALVREYNGLIKKLEARGLSPERRKSLVRLKAVAVQVGKGMSLRWEDEMIAAPEELQSQRARAGHEAFNEGMQKMIEKLRALEKGSR